MEKENLIDATVQSFRVVTSPRFFSDERGYQGELLASLRRILGEQGILEGGCILQIEPQKTRLLHKTTQRPDIILHIPYEVSGANVSDNNYAVWALKRRATPAGAKDDFDKLDEMFSRLHYPIGFFVNIDSDDPHIEHYQGNFQDRLLTYAVRLQDRRIKIVVGYYSDGVITKENLSFELV